MIVPNIFQLSSGETSLFDIFLSILRDFELSGSQFSNAADIRGIVVVDEMDLHLHAVHQHEVLPSLIGMFPKGEGLFERETTASSLAGKEGKLEKGAMTGEFG